jgi:hypothetical protein
MLPWVCLKSSKQETNKNIAESCVSELKYNTNRIEKISFLEFKLKLVGLDKNDVV